MQINMNKKLFLFFILIHLHTLSYVQKQIHVHTLWYVQKQIHIHTLSYVQKQIRIHTLWHVQKQGIKLTYMPFIVKALSMTLSEFPEINASFSDDQVHVSFIRVPWRILVNVWWPGMGWLRLVGPLKLQVSFAKEPHKRDYILQKRPIFFFVWWPGICLIHTCDTTNSCQHVTWHIHMCDKTQLHKSVTHQIVSRIELCRV